jgi:hypothetical protein
LATSEAPGSGPGSYAEAHGVLAAVLRADAYAAMLNFDIADHPVYHGLELQWFDDAAHGTGMLAFLGHRDSHVFDYYAQRGLRLDPAGYQIGAGTGAWVETDFADALLEVSDGDQVHAGLDVTEHWRPRRLPMLIRAVTTVVPVFRRWPATYRWKQSSVPAARPRVAGEGSTPQAATTVGPPAPDQTPDLAPLGSPAATAQKTQSVPASMHNNARTSALCGHLVRSCSG